MSQKACHTRRWDRVRVFSVRSARAKEEEIYAEKTP